MSFLNLSFCVSYSQIVGKSLEQSITASQTFVYDISYWCLKTIQIEEKYGTLYMKSFLRAREKKLIYFTFMNLSMEQDNKIINVQHRKKRQIDHALLFCVYVLFELLRSLDRYI